MPQAGLSRRDWLGIFHGIATLAAVAAACAAIVQGCTAVSSLKSSLKQIESFEKQNQELAAKAELRDWQKLIVLSIVDNAGVEGITFREILSKYREEANALKMEVPKEELTPSRLIIVLSDLRQFDMAYLAKDGRYYGNIAVLNPRAGVVFSLEDAKLKGLMILQTESGRYSMDEYLARLQSESGLPLSEVTGVVVDLLSLGSIVVDEEKKVWSVLKFPNQPVPIKQTE